MEEQCVLFSVIRSFGHNCIIDDYCNETSLARLAKTHEAPTGAYGSPSDGRLFQANYVYDTIKKKRFYIKLKENERSLSILCDK